jgi:hypothetical protein
LPQPAPVEPDENVVQVPAVGVAHDPHAPHTLLQQ